MALVQYQKDSEGGGSELALGITTKWSYANSNELAPGVSRSSLPGSDEDILAIVDKLDEYQDDHGNMMGRIAAENHEAFTAKPRAGTIDVIGTPVSITSFKGKDGKTGEPYCHFKISKVVRTADPPSSDDHKTFHIHRRCYLTFGFNKAEVAESLKPESPLFKVHYIFDYLNDLRLAQEALPTKEEGLNQIPDIIKNCAVAQQLSSLIPSCTLANAPIYHILTPKEKSDRLNKSKNKPTGSSGNSNANGDEDAKSGESKPPRLEGAELKDLVTAGMQDPVIAQIVVGTISEWAEASQVVTLHIGDQVKFKLKANTGKEISNLTRCRVEKLQACCAIQPLAKPTGGASYVKVTPYYSYDKMYVDKKIGQMSDYHNRMKNKKYTSWLPTLREVMNGNASKEISVSIIPSFLATIYYLQPDSCAIYFPNLVGKLSNDKQWCTEEKTVGGGSDTKVTHNAIRTQLTGLCWRNGPLINPIKTSDGSTVYRVSPANARRVQIIAPLWSERVKQLGIDDADYSWWKEFGPTILLGFHGIVEARIDEQGSLGLESNKSAWMSTETVTTATESKNGESSADDDDDYYYNNLNDAMVAIREKIMKGVPDVILRLWVDQIAWCPASIISSVGIPMSQKAAAFMVGKQGQRVCTGCNSQEFGVINLSRKSPEVLVNNISDRDWAFACVLPSLKLSDSLRKKMRGLDPAATDLIFCDDYQSAVSRGNRTSYFDKCQVPSDHDLRRFEFNFGSNFSERYLIFAIKKSEIIINEDDEDDDDEDSHTHESGEDSAHNPPQIAGPPPSAPPSSPGNDKKRKRGDNDQPVVESGEGSTSPTKKPTIEELNDGDRGIDESNLYS